MLSSMTGFGCSRGKIADVGDVSIELRSTNHKFLDVVFHVPETFLSLEDRIKKVIESQVKRGRVTCAISILRPEGTGVSINKPLLKGYIAELEGIREQFKLGDGIRLDTLIHLPGVLCVTQNMVPAQRIAPQMEALARRALEDMVKTRRKEGRALYTYLKRRSQTISGILSAAGARFKKIIKQRLSNFNTDDERVSFLKTTDISEEVDRLTFHIRNFRSKIAKNGPIGKELDFIAQEMQREANTIGAKSCSAAISARVVQIKSQIEKIREQAQNIE